MATELTQLTSQVRDVSLYYKNGALLRSEHQLAELHSFSRVGKNLAKDMYGNFNYSLNHCVQFKLVKKLFGDKYDISYITIYIFPSLADFKE